MNSLERGYRNKILLPEFYQETPKKVLNGLAIAGLFAIYDPNENEYFHIESNTVVFASEKRFKHKKTGGKDLIYICQNLQRVTSWFRLQEDYISLLKHSLKGLKSYQKILSEPHSVLQETIDKIEQLFLVRHLLAKSVGNAFTLIAADKWLKTKFNLKSMQKEVYDLYTIKSVRSNLKNKALLYSNLTLMQNLEKKIFLAEQMLA